MKNPERTLGVAEMSNSIGDGAFYVCSALYFTGIIGLSIPQVGLALTIGWGLGALAGVPIGRLADHVGARGTAALLAAGTAAAVAAMLFVRSFPPFLLVVCAYTVCQSSLLSTRQALLAGLIDHGRRTRVRAYLQATRNGALAVGAALGGLALYAGTPSAFLTVFAIDAASFLITAGVLLRLPAVSPAVSPAVNPGVSPMTGPAARQPLFAVLRDRPYAVVSALNMILLLHMPLLSVAMPLWIALRTTAPAWTVAALFVVNTLSVVLLQVRVARKAAGLAAASRLIRSAGMLMLVACVVFALSAGDIPSWGAAAVLLAGTAVLVVGEMMVASGGWEISFALAPPGRHGQYQGFFGMGTAMARMIGPALLTTLLLGWGTPGWLALGGLFLIAALGVGPAVRRVERGARAALVNGKPDHADLNGQGAAYVAR